MDTRSAGIYIIGCDQDDQSYELRRRDARRGAVKGLGEGDGELSVVAIYLLGS
jgi:hypothetical protein